MRKDFLAGIVLSIVAVSAYAGTDFQCVQRCTNQGYQYQLCMSKCSWDDGSTVQQSNNSGLGAAAALLTPEQPKPYEPVDFN